MATAEEASKEGSAASAGRGTLAAIVLVTFAGLLSASALSPFLPIVAGDLQTSVVLLGQIIALSFFLAAGIGLLVGPLADRYGNRPLLLVGIFTAAVTSLGTAIASTVTMLLLAVLVSAFTRAIVQPVSMAIAGTHFEGAARRRAISGVMAALSATAVVGIPVMTSLALYLDWRGAFGALAIFAVGVGIFALAALPREEQRPRQRLRFGTLLASFAPLLHHSPMLALIGTWALRYSSIMMVATYFGAFLVQSFGFTTPQIGIAYMILGLGILFGSVLAGSRLGQFPLRANVIITSLLLTFGIAGALILPLGAGGAVALVTVAMVAAGYGTVAMSTLLLTESPAGRATTMTLSQAANSLGGAGGAALGGLLLDLGGYPAIGLSLPIFGVAAAGLVWLTRPRAAADPAPVVPPSTS